MQACEHAIVRSRSFGVRFAATLVAAASWSGTASGSALVTRSPVPGAAGPNYLESAYSESGVAVLNAGAASEAFSPGYRVTTRGQADNTTGLIKGSAGFVLDADSSTAVPQAQFDNFLDGTATVSGAPLGSSVSVTLTLDAHASFVNLAGKPQAIFLAYLYVGPLTQIPAYGSQLEFELLSPSGTIRTSAIGFQGASPTSPPYAGAVPVITSAIAGNLAGQARITFNAIVGSPLYVQAVLGGAAAPAVIGGQRKAGSGNVDAWGSAQLGVLMPSGYSLTGASGVLAANGIVSTVPEAATRAYLAIGLLALALSASKQRRRLA